MSVSRRRKVSSRPDPTRGTQAIGRCRRLNRRLTRRHGGDLAAVQPAATMPCAEKAVRDSDGRRQRRRQDHHHRQTGAPPQAQGKSVMLAAGDTFRAAAVEQLQVWGERNNIPVIAQRQRRGLGLGHFRCAAIGTGARHRCADRRHRRPSAHPDQPDGGAEEDQTRARQARCPRPHEVMLVVDAGTGQNALNQA